MAGPIVHAECGVAGPRRLEQVGLVAEPEHPIVVREIDVAIEGHRSQVREVVETVALQPRTELQLQREADGEERRQDERRPRRSGFRDDGDRRRETRRCRTSPPAPGDACRAAACSSERRAISRPASSIDNDSEHTPRPPARVFRRTTFRIRSSGPGWSFDGVKRATSRASRKSRDVVAVFVGIRSAGSRGTDRRSARRRPDSRFRMPRSSRAARTAAA